ncbi:hypothetical protein CPB84DRAFT_1851161 [Gymnopilus junonius]|uniref:Uncharacterized protein n=1 Tax=Gymnopilus junonius TaxID=109634 RepID=A0A9P5NG07_GYMJU|nr:hypothetical protein CPB84DRAFT_1851161 [Gymnopilus junonius]
MTPEHFVDLAKLYDFYTKGFEDGKSTHKARVHIPATPMPAGQAPAQRVQSAPTILDLLNTENIAPNEADIEALEEELFNQPDPYDLAKTDQADAALDDDIPITRSSTRFDIAEFIKLDDAKLKALLLNVDIEGPSSNL